MEGEGRCVVSNYSSYGFSKTVDIPYDEAVERARASLNAEGFGVLSEIDMKEKLKEKLGVDFRNYVILGTCNPPLAYKTLQQDINIGLLRQTLAVRSLNREARDLADRYFFETPVRLHRAGEGDLLPE